MAILLGMGDIPRVMHRIWIGPRGMPRDFAAWGRRWEQLHPGWEHRLWTDEDLAKLVGDTLVDRVDNVGAKSDVLRYELLYRFGGVYVDCDFEPFKPIDGLIGDCAAFVTEMEVGLVNNGLLASAPGHPLFGELLDRLPARLQAHPEERAFDLTGPTLLAEVLAEGADRFRPPSVVVHPPGLFYPYHYSEKWRREEEFPDAYAAHHWAGSWIPPVRGWQAVRVHTSELLQRRAVTRRLLGTRVAHRLVGLRRALSP